jgi:regulator of sigma E protease
MILGIVFVIIFLSILVLIHELGHFLAAKKFGLLVEEFGFGLPPRIWGKKIGETIYSINALPFGGFVKIYGEDKEGDGLNADSRGPRSRRFTSLRGRLNADSRGQKRISIIETEEILNSNKQIEASEEIVIKEENKILDDKRSFQSLPISKRMIIIFAGVLMNFLFGWLVISIVFSLGIPQAVLITSVAKDSPADTINLQPGDKIIGFSKVDDFIKFIDENRGKEITLKIEREGKVKEFKTIPRINPPLGEGALGIALIESGLPKKNLLASVWEGLKTSLKIIQMVFVAIFNLMTKAFVGKANLEQVTGPIGIVKLTAQAGSLGFIYLLQLLALISLNLVAINIFPFPALDGGRLLFLLIEKIKGSPLPIKFEKYANAVGMVFLLLLMLVITIKDIMRF